MDAFFVKGRKKIDPKTLSLCVAKVCECLTDPSLPLPSITVSTKKHSPFRCTETFFLQHDVIFRSEEMEEKSGI